MHSKRLWACLLGGVLSAAICTLGAQIIFGFPPFDWEHASRTVANRILLGFVVGISGCKMSHLLHGALLGLLISLTVSIGFLPSDLLRFFLFTSAGIIYGLLIEWLATDILHAPMRSA